MTRKTVGLFLIAALFLGGTPLSLADTISQPVDTATASAPDLLFGGGLYLGYTYTYGLGAIPTSTLNSLKLKFDGRPDNSWAVEFFCKTGALFSSTACASSFGNATTLTPSATTDGTAEYTATWSGTNTFESDKFYFFQLRVDQNTDQSTPATLSGSAANTPEGTCEAGQSTDDFCTALPDPYFVLDYTLVAPPDTTAPVISIDFGPTEAQHLASSTPSFSFSSDDPAATYACAWDGLATSTCTSPVSQTLADGAHSFSVVATDLATNSSTLVRTFVVDTIAPVLSGMPSDQTVEATGASTTVNYSSPTATDEGDGAVATNCAPASGSGFSLGSTTVSCTATDSLGHTATSTFVVGVVDTTAPVISNTPSDMTLEATAASTSASYTLPSAFDAVSGSTTVSCAPASGSGFGLGSTTVSCSTQDGAGNTASSTFVVGIIDTTAPVVTLTGAASISLTVGDSFTDPGATATDLGAAISVSTTGSVNTALAGSYTLTYTASDTAGNTASTTRVVTVSAAPPSSGGGNGNNGNGPPVPNPSQGLPQGLILGVTTKAVERASERAKQVVSDIFVPSSPSVTAPKNKNQEKVVINLPKAEPQPTQTPWDLPAGAETKPMTAAVANTQFEIQPWMIMVALLVGLLGLGYTYRRR